ncbi:hypothetical protein FACS189442_6120 [Spirochaetia bacterium]|nr:hypothetical protein FACS189442_6120 [Spirochaetia bacterium]
MGQKVNPIGLRLGINKTWASRWYVDPREYADTLHEDLKLRSYIMAMPETKGAEPNPFHPGAFVNQNIPDIKHILIKLLVLAKRV